MKHLKKFNENHLFDPSSLEDILLEVADEGLEWYIRLGRGSKGESDIDIVIDIGDEVDDINWDIIKSCVLRVSDYVKGEGYIYLDGYTNDLVNSINFNKFDTSEFISGYQNSIQLHFYK